MPNKENGILRPINRNEAQGQQEEQNEIFFGGVSEKGAVDIAGLICYSQEKDYSFLFSFPLRKPKSNQTLGPS